MTPSSSRLRFGSSLLTAALVFVALAACSSAPPTDSLEARDLPPRRDDDGTDPSPVLPAPGDTVPLECGAPSCVLGAVECATSSSARVCERDSAECPAWSARPCVSGTSCNDTADACLGQAPSCTDECTTVGAKKCAQGSSAGVLECRKNASGCKAWEPAADCAADMKCDQAENDGTCVPGCSDDAGCSSSNVGAKRCASNGTASQTCTKQGLCHVWSTTATALQECSGSGPYACSGTSARKECQTSSVGACTAHKIVTTACAAGTACSGSGECKAVCPPPDGCDATKAGTLRCKAGSTTMRQLCTNQGGCYRWIDTACGSGRVCSAGACVCNGCLVGTECHAGNTGAACGSGGKTCSVCSGASVCSATKTCVCGGCTAGSQCYLGTSLPNCGHGGGTCTDCNAFCAERGKVASACSGGFCVCAAAQ